jgi:hypothetical protein
MFVATFGDPGTSAPPRVYIRAEPTTQKLFGSVFRLQSNDAWWPSSAE